MKIFQDNNGNTSSKRIIGSIGMLLFFLIIITSSILSWKGIEIGSMASDLVTSLGLVSGGLLGVGVIENFKK